MGALGGVGGGVGRGVGGGRGGKEHHSYCNSVFASLYNTLRKVVEQDTLSQASMPLATMPKTLGIYRIFRHFLQHAAQGCGTRKAFTSVLAFADHAQNTGIYSVFVSLQAADLTFKGLHSGLTHSISETKRQRNSKNLVEHDVIFCTS